MMSPHSFAVSSRSMFALVALLAAFSAACSGASDVSTEVSEQNDVSDLDAQAEVHEEATPLGYSHVIRGDECWFPQAKLPALVHDLTLERCGMSEFEWLEDEVLGMLLGEGESRTFSAALLNTLLVSEGFVLPATPTYDADLQVISYQTQDRGRLVDASALVAAPIGYDPNEGPLPIVLFLHGTTGFEDSCATSTNFAWQGLTSLIVSMGFVVVVPDYLGLRSLGESTEPHPYLVGEPTAIASLDAVRAAARLVASGRFGEICVRPDFISYGGSQGGHAALWVDRLAPYYSAELNHLGAFASVPVVDLSAQVAVGLSTLDKSTGNAVAVLRTMATWYGGENELDAVFTAEGRVLADQLVSGTCDGDIVDFSPIRDSSLETLFAPEILAAVEAGELDDYGLFGCALRESSLNRTSVPRVSSAVDEYALAIANAENDELVERSASRAAYTDLCNQGLDVHYTECTGADHAGGIAQTFGTFIGFALQRAQGLPISQHDVCVEATPSSCLD